ncbi:class I SAM-dependent methyltransferase [Caenimonas sp. SL110]|uniref:class I SAM-dependent methyltransferase n=1 Tax=Caenimonas sp. SL110 TaxID=1450524 RepID=UPI0006544004|nr:class I SAM-dependent methyltransferase [Caenimonas sp. SL110]
MAAPGRKATSAQEATSAVHSSIRDYYSARALRHGATPLGVDWTCVPTQELRFVQLLKVITPAASVSVNDIGCGYGAMAGFIHRRLRATAIDYLGIDLAPEMIALARKKNRRPSVCFELGTAAPRQADYSVASGIFNVRLYHSQEVWEAAVAHSLADMARTSRLGFAVNFLAPCPDGPLELYRPSPAFWINYCRNELGLQAQLLDNYGMREFTLLVRTSLR